jgi:hypothetical protein
VGSSRLFSINSHRRKKVVKAGPEVSINGGAQEHGKSSEISLAEHTTVYSLHPTSKLDGRQRQKARETIQAGESFRGINVPSVGRARGGNEAIGAEDETQHYTRVRYAYCSEVQQSHWKALQSMIHRHKTILFRDITIVVASNSTVLQHLSFPQRRSIKVFSSSTWVLSRFPADTSESCPLRHMRPTNLVS